MDAERLRRLALGRAGIKKDEAQENAKNAKPRKSLEESCAEEVDEIATAFRQRITREDKRRRLATDSEFWCALYFQSREEKEAFLRKYDLLALGDKYISGQAFDRILHKQIQAKDGHRKER